VLVMPRAEKSLRQHLDDAAGPLEAVEAAAILSDIATALADLDGKVVHRDLKPENVLFLDGTWCLADFGISRYAEATTALDTRKYALSKEYAAPERWRSERATTATDVYALGVIAYELLSGSRPFAGPELHDFREQHLHRAPERLAAVPATFGALIEECLYKAAGARPYSG
jgi:eukaryotic-like serine/threonine-protein kinase